MPASAVCTIRPQSLRAVARQMHPRPERNEASRAAKFTGYHRTRFRRCGTIPTRSSAGSKELGCDWQPDFLERPRVERAKTFEVGARRFSPAGTLAYVGPVGRIAFCQPMPALAPGKAIAIAEGSRRGIGDVEVEGLAIGRAWPSLPGATCTRHDAVSAYDGSAKAMTSGYAIRDYSQRLVIPSRENSA
jgi:hypothetical protein